MKLFKLQTLFITALVTGGPAAMAQQKPAASPLATKAKVTVTTEDGKTVIPLKREEQIAYMFVMAIADLEDTCGRHAAEPCTLEALARGAKSSDGWGMKLKYDPTTTDPNYTYKLVLKGKDWELWANPRKPGLGGFYNKGHFFGGTWYNSAGPASEKDKKVSGSIAGDLFSAQ